MDENPLVLAATKSIIGHTEGSAGVAGDLGNPAVDDEGIWETSTPEFVLLPLPGLIKMIAEFNYRMGVTENRDLKHSDCLHGFMQKDPMVLCCNFKDFAISSQHFKPGVCLHDF